MVQEFLTLSVSVNFPKWFHIVPSNRLFILRHSSWTHSECRSTWFVSSSHMCLESKQILSAKDWIIEGTIEEQLEVHLWVVLLKVSSPSPGDDTDFLHWQFRRRVWEWNAETIFISEKKPNLFPFPPELRVSPSSRTFRCKFIPSSSSGGGPGMTTNRHVDWMSISDEGKWEWNAISRQRHSQVEVILVQDYWSMCSPFAHLFHPMEQLWFCFHANLPLPLIRCHNNVHSCHWRFNGDWFVPKRNVIQMGDFGL